MYSNRLSLLLKRKSDFLKIKKCITVENLHKHRLLDIRFGLGAGGKPYKYVPPAEGEGTSQEAETTKLHKSPSPIINQDDEDLNVYRGDEARADESKEIPASPRGFPSRASLPVEPVAPDDLTEEQLFKELSKIPLPDDVYTQEDFEGEPFFPISEETTVPVEERETTQTSLTSGPGLLGGIIWDAQITCTV